MTTPAAMAATAVQTEIFEICSHEVRPVSVDEGTQGQAALPGHGEIRDSDIPVSLRLPLAPAQQLTGSSDGFWNRRLDVKKAGLRSTCKEIRSRAALRNSSRAV